MATLKIMLDTLLDPLKNMVQLHKMFRVYFERTEVSHVRKLYASGNTQQVI